MIVVAIENVFNQFKFFKPTSDDTYPLGRAILLMETLSRDLNEQLLKILSDFQLMYLEYADFEKMREEIREVFKKYYAKITEFRQHLNTTRLRLDASSTKVLENIMKNPLIDRLEKIFIFRQHHAKFVEIINKTLVNDKNLDKKNLDAVALTQINEAYNLFNSINVLDISKEGFQSWESTERLYYQKIEKIET
jgi:dynein heavy chain 1